jgi:hypothetical protein
MGVLVHSIHFQYAKITYNLGVLVYGGIKILRFPSNTRISCELVLSSKVAKRISY